MSTLSSHNITSGRLLGRDHELGLIEDLLRSTGVDGTVLVFVGEAGVGKSALLDVAATRATSLGHTVLRINGTEFERGLGYSALNQALLPVRGHLAALEESQRDALSVALGLRTGGPVDRLVVSTAALHLVQAASAERPVLIVADDAQWVDHPSIDVLLFMGRRLRGARVGMLGAVRSESSPLAAAHSGLVRHELRPLDDESAAKLLRSRFPLLAPRVRGRLLTEARGNPLALLELPPRLSPRVRAGLQGPPAMLPLSTRLRTTFADRIRKLPDSARDLVLLAALEPTGDVALIRRAAATDDVRDLVLAEDLGILSIRDVDGRLAFRHPLMRSAAVEEISTADQRRQAHRRLAEASADDPDRQAWHLAEAGVEPDERIAELVAECGQRALARGDSGGIDFLVRAAELSPSPADHGRRLGQAAFLAAYATAGSAQRAGELAGSLRDAPPGSDAALFAACTTAWLLISSGGDLDTTYRIMSAATAAAGPRYDTRNAAHLTALYTLLQIVMSTADGERTRRFLDLLSSVGPAGHPATRLLRVQSAMILDPVRCGAARIDELDEMLATIDAATDPVDLVRLAGAALLPDRLAECRVALTSTLTLERDGTETTQAIAVRAVLVYDAYASGRWAEAAELIENVRVRGAEADNQRLVVQVGLPGGLIAAATGDDAGVRRWSELIQDWSRRCGTTLDRHHRSLVLARHAISNGDFEQAFTLASSVAAPGDFPRHGKALWAILDLVESAVRTGRLPEARAHVDAMLRHDIARLAPRYAMLTDACAALVDGSTRRFEQAVSTFGADRVPFDLARVRLLFGEHLIRSGESGRADEQLGLAAATFRRLGARPWLDRCDPAAGPRPPVVMELTPLEHRIVALAATGLTNKQIGGTLHLSPRTVSTYLYRVFPKLGVSTRAGLRDALTALESR